MATVLLEGETGTGKELFARAIHSHGPRSRGPFIAVNCAAMSSGLLESELFGHARGAFTGAERSRRGLFEAATRGTLFLDEVSETSPSFQGQLLRVLQDGEIRALGADGSRRVDTRVVAATNCELSAAVERGCFRRDLYYRLRVFPLRLPPLRERTGDVSELAAHFLQQFSVEEQKVPGPLDSRTLELLQRHSWPGNVRELQNEIRRLVVSLEAGQRIAPWLLSPSITNGEQPPTHRDERPLKEIVRDVERSTIRDRLRLHGYRRTATAHSLCVSREWLWQKMRQLGIEDPRRTGSMRGNAPRPCQCAGEETRWVREAALAGEPGEEGLDLG
jgi:Nif-specific regulatory protein